MMTFLRSSFLPMLLIPWIISALMPAAAGACSCFWQGPFLKVARQAPLVIRGTIIRHHPGPAPAMDVHVLETLSGGLLDSGMRIQMGDGMHCRPSMDGFPPGSEWILALNGAGAKPANGWALSHCGEYWLRVESGQVIGSIDGDEKQVKQIPLDEFKDRFLYPKFDQQFSGKITAGQQWRRAFGGRFEFILEPAPAGWEIIIREYGREENLSRLTAPLHAAANPREIEGWQLSDRPADCASRPYEAEAGPANPRQFIYSPEVGRQIDGPDAGRWVTPEEVQRIELFGRGTLTIEQFNLRPGTETGCPIIEWLQFSVRLEGGY
ncbi:MAG: hypothetical protein AB1724_16735 [Thermodesulfobacteriota bacterium]